MIVCGRRIVRDFRVRLRCDLSGDADCYVGAGCDVSWLEDVGEGVVMVDSVPDSEVCVA